MRSDAPTGHAVIQVNANGENAIVITGGANQTLDETDAVRVLADFGPSDYLLVQNEISSVPAIIRLAHQRGLTVVFNPAPMTASIAEVPLDLVDILILNETEAGALAGCDDADAIRSRLIRRFPRAALVFTMGARGAAYCREGSCCHQPGESVDVVDTTAAGDTFAGFFLAELIRGNDPAQALAIGCRAAALCVTRPGAAESIPDRREVALGTIQAIIPSGGENRD
jgi:ribokinase